MYILYQATLFGFFATYFSGFISLPGAGFNASSAYCTSSENAAVSEF